MQVFIILSVIFIVVCFLMYPRKSLFETNKCIPTIAYDKVYYTSIEAEVLTLVNKYRNFLGLSTLIISDFLSNVAEVHTDFMIKEARFSHENFNERAQILVSQSCAESVGENVAYGYGTAKGVVKSWIESDEHRVILENPRYTHFGISIKQDTEGRNYFTNIFIKTKYER